MSAPTPGVPLLSEDPGSLPEAPLAGGGPLAARFRAAGASSFRASAALVRRLPYGRISSRARPELVLEEGRGTCTTKHALLAELARELGLDVRLILGIYEMHERNTPGIGPVLARHGLAAMPEAHCYLQADGGRVDVTREVDAAEPIAGFLHEEPIAAAQIGDYKIALHRRVLADWMARIPALQGRTLDEVWAIREECIAALAAPA